jgi:hypothetical protein
MNSAFAVNCERFPEQFATFQRCKRLPFIVQRVRMIWAHVVARTRHQCAQEPLGLHCQGIHGMDVGAHEC